MLSLPEIFLQIFEKMELQMRYITAINHKEVAALIYFMARNIPKRSVGSTREFIGDTPGYL